MKTVCALISLILSGASAVSAGPAVQWLSTEHNFGAFDEDMGPVECTFRFVNTGDEPVAITAARASCGCTAPRYDKNPVAPGDTSEIVVRYDPAGRPGRFHKYVAVDFSYPDSRRKLDIRGTVVGSSESLSRFYHADCTPWMKLERGSVLMGEIKKGALKTAFLKLYNAAHDSISPSVSGLPDYIKANIEPRKVAPGEQASFVFYFDSKKCPYYGVVSDTVYVSPDPLSSTLCYLPLTAIVNEDFSGLTPKELAKAPVARVADSTVDFGTLRGTEPVVRTVEVQNMGKTPLMLRRVYSADNGVSMTVDTDKVKPGKKVTVTITVDPKAVTGAMLMARGIIITNDPAAPLLNLRLSGQLDR